MATKAKDTFVRSSKSVSIFPDALPLLGATTTFNQGDLIALDTSAHVLKAVANATDCQNLLGVSPVTVVNGALKSSYQGTAVDAAQSAVSLGGPEANVECLFKLHNGDTFNPGDLVYPSIGDDAQTISSSNPCSVVACGVFQDAAITAGASSTGRALIGHRYPGNTLVI